VLRRRHDLPLVPRALQPQPGPFVRRPELGERVLDRTRRSTGDAPELVLRDRLFGNEEDGLDGVG